MDQVTLLNRVAPALRLVTCKVKDIDANRFIACGLVFDVDEKLPWVLVGFNVGQHTLALYW